MADASLTIAIKTDPAQPLQLIVKQAKEAQSEVEGLGAAFGKIGAALGGIAALKGTFDFVLNATRQMQDLTTQFITFTGSAEGAAKQMEKLTQFANESPFELAEVADANRILLAFGSTTAQSIEQLRQLGEVSAGTGKDLSELATIFGQIQAEGKLTGERFNQLIERGVNIGPELAKSLGVASTSIRGLISDSKISSDEVAKAFQKMTSEGGIFFGSTERLSKTVSGSLSTLSDAVTSLAAEIGKQGAPAFNQYAQALTSVIGSINDFVKERNKLAESPEEQQIQKLKDRLQELETIFQNLAQPKGTIQRTLTSLLFTGGEEGLEREKRSIAEKIKSVNQEIIDLTTERNKKLEAENQRATDAENKRIADQKASKEQGLADELARKRKEEEDKATQDRANRILETEKNITQIELQEEAVRQALRAEQEGARSALAIEALTAREQELTSAKLNAEATRADLLLQYDEAELLRAQDKQNKLLEIQKAGEAKRTEQEKKENEGRTQSGIAARKQYNDFLKSSYQTQVDDARVGLSAIASLQKSGSRDAFNIGKRAAQAQVLLDIPKAAFAAYTSLIGIPYVGPILAPLAAAAAVAAGTAQLRQIESQTFGMAEGGLVPGIGNKDTVPALLTPGETVVPKSNFEDLKSGIERQSIMADELILLQQGNEISGKILDTLTIGSVGDKLTTVIAILNQLPGKLDSIASAASSSSSSPAAEVPEVNTEPQYAPGTGASGSVGREPANQKTRNQQTR